MTDDEFEQVYPVWVLWQATERKHLPKSGGLLAQPERLMQNILTLDDHFGRMVNQVEERRRKKQGK